jgi:CRP-like cAMP-binding protein
MKAGLKKIIKNNCNTRREFFRKGDFLFTENAQPDKIYCIESGIAKLFKQNPDGEQVIINLVSTGEILGLHSVIDGQPYTCSCDAISNITTLSVWSNDFMDLLESNNDYKTLVVQNLCSTIDQVERHIAIMHEKKTFRRIAETLLWLENKYGHDRLNKLKANLTPDELASYTGTSKSYMKKIISNFSGKGLALLSSNSIRILDFVKIKKITQNHSGNGAIIALQLGMILNSFL